MKNGNHTERDQLEGNVEKLLAHAPPRMSMPESGKARVLAALMDRRSKPLPIIPAQIARGITMLRSRQVVYAAAVATAAALILISLWQSHPSRGIAWADVVRHLDDMSTFTGWSRCVEISDSGERTVFWSKLYYRDPHMSRYDSYATAGAQLSELTGAHPLPEHLQSIVITARGQDRSTETRFFPAQMLARRTTLIFQGTKRDAREETVRDFAAISWTKLKTLASDETRKIGEREFGGVRAVGFEVPASALFGPPPHGGSGAEVLRLWATKETAIPIMVEMEFTSPNGTVYRTRIKDLAWNVPLSVDLFDVSAFKGYELAEKTVTLIGFRKTALNDDVTFRVGPKGGPSVVTERDIAAVVSGEATRDFGQENTRPVLMIEVAPAAHERLRAYTATHIGEWVVFDFNGEIQTDVRIGGVISERMQLDITPLDITMEQFEERYLTTLKPAEAP